MFPKRTMDESLFRKIIDECSRHRNIVLINLFMNNEPLTDPYLAERINYAKKRVPWAAVCIFTNGLLLTDSKIDSLKRSQLDAMSVSFHGIRKKTIEESMGIPYDTALRRINNFIEEAKDRWLLKDFLSINFLKHQYMGEEEKEEAVQYWRSRGVQKINFHEGPISRAGNVPGMSGLRREGRIVGCLSVLEDEMIHITEDGKVVLCCMDWRREVILGDLNTESIAEVWNGRRKEVWDSINGHTEVADGFLCRRCEEAAERASFEAADELDIAVVLLPPAHTDDLSQWSDALVGDLKSSNLSCAVLDLDTKYRKIAESAHREFRVGKPEPRFYSGETSREWIENRNLRDLLTNCVHDLLALPTHLVGFPLGKANRRFVLEVSRKLKKMAPEMQILLLDRDETLINRLAFLKKNAADTTLVGRQTEASHLARILREDRRSNA